MADFLSVEDSAAQLGVGEATLRGWIKRGLARATRRGGDYILRQTEVDRLRVETPEFVESGEKEPAVTEVLAFQDLAPAPALPEVGSVQPEVKERPRFEAESTTAPRRPKALPPRSNKDPESFSGERDRRRRMGRRASDFTLEILHHEIKSAISAALNPLLPQLDELKSHLSRPTGGGEVDALLARVAELENQQQHFERAREEFRQRLEESENERKRLEQAASTPDPYLLKRMEEAERERARLESALQQGSAPDPVLLRRVEEAERERARLELAVQQSVQRFTESEQERQRLELWVQQTQQQQAQHEDGAQQLLQRLTHELQAERQLRQESQEQLERMRAELADLQSNSLTMEAERARFSLESRSLQGEIDRLTSLQEKWEGQKRDQESTHNRLQLLEKTNQDAERRLEEREQELRRLREQVNSLNYRLQMAGTGSAGPSPEESRKLMERLADAQAEMAEKNQLITQHYSEIGELRSKLDTVQRSHYEMQQRYEKLYDEWGQLAAQLAAKQMSDHQQQQAPPPSSDRKGWGLFGRRE